MELGPRRLYVSHSNEKNMQQPDFSEFVETAIAMLGGHPTSKEVEMAAERLFIKANSLRKPTSSVLPAVQCSISLANCTSRRASTQRSHVYDEIRKAADKLQGRILKTAEEVGMLQVPALEIVVRDTTNLWSGHQPSEVMAVSEAIHQAAVDSGVDRATGPFLDLSLPQNFALLEVIPEILGRWERLEPIVQLGTDQDPPSDEVIYGVALALATHRHQSQRTHSKVALVVNGCDKRAFGRRVHSSVLALSVAYSEATDIDLAFEFGQVLAQTCQTCYELTHLERRIHSEKALEPASTQTSIYRNVRVSDKLDGFPQFGLNQNRISFPQLLSAEEIASFVSARLTPFSYSGQSAGIVLDFRA